MIEAAGGVVWRPSGNGAIEVLVVHRPRRDDWSLPKGKRRRGEAAVECALREVREETGLRCSIGPELPDLRYRSRKGRRKHVRYWAMDDPRGAFRPNDEVDEVRWVRLDDLHRVLSRPRELRVVDGLRSALPVVV